MSDGELSREHGQTAVFTAEPDEGYQFGNWTIKEGTDCPTLQDPSNPKLTFTVEGNCSLEAIFAKAPRTITIGENDPVTGIKNGEITITPSLTVNHGEDVEVTATANQHYEFKGWTGTCGDLNNDESTITITLVSDCTIEAIFEKLSYTITSTSSDGGQVHHLGSVIDEELFVKYGETVTLTATPQEGYQFTEWTTIGDADCPALTGDDTSNPEWTQSPRLEFVVEGNCSLEAVFNRAPRMISIAENDNGEINITPSETVEHGDKVEITAKANQHYEFKGWDGTCGDLNNDESSITIIAVKDCTIEAVFGKVSYTIKVTSSEGGSVARDGQQVNEELSVVYGETVAFTVTPDESYRFAGWTTEGGTSSSSCPSLEDSTEVETEFIVEGNCGLNAVFEKAVFTISVASSEGGSVTRDGQQIDEELSLVHGQKATITAIPDEGYVFVQWKSVEGTDCPSLSDDDASDPDRTRAPRLEFTVLGACQLQAIFTQKPYTIRTSSNEGGEITETLTADEGQEVSITATADEHHEFKDWEGNCGEFKAEDLTISFEATKDCEIKAVFTRVLYTMTVEAGSGGSVDKTEEEIGFGDNFKVEATPDDGYGFERWTTTGSGCPDDLDTTYSIASFEVEGNCQLQAEFIFTGEFDELPVEGETPQEELQTNNQESTDKKTNPTVEDEDEKKGLQTNNQECACKETHPTNNDPPTDQPHTYRIECDYTRTELLYDDGGIIKATYAAQSKIGQRVTYAGQQYLIADTQILRSQRGGNNLQYVVTTFVTNMNKLFKDNADFNQDISSWDVSNVTYMRQMFAHATSFNQDISGWDVSNVIDMSYMFENAIKFNQPIGKWDVGNVKNMAFMFELASSFNKYIGNWDVSNAGNMRYMFQSAHVFNQDISSWDVGNVTDMSNMFASATSFNQDISGWDVSSVTNMSSMFYKALKFNQPIGIWDVGNVKNMSSMFENTGYVTNTGFNQDISSWNVSAVENMRSMFRFSIFNKPISKWDVRNVKNMSYMFEGTGFYQDIHKWDVICVCACKDFHGGNSSDTSRLPSFPDYCISRDYPDSP